MYTLGDAGQRLQSQCQGEAEMGLRDCVRVFSAEKERKAFQTEGAWRHGGCPGDKEKLVWSMKLGSSYAGRGPGHQEESLDYPL